MYFAGNYKINKNFQNNLCKIAHALCTCSATIFKVINIPMYST